MGRKLVIGGLAAAALLVGTLFSVSAGRDDAPSPSRSPVAPSPESPSPDPSGQPRFVDVLSGERTALPRSITSLGATDLRASADGSRLVFVGGGGALYVSDIDGSRVRQLTETQPAASFARDPRWSPDGTHIVYVSGNRIHVIDVATGAVTALTRDLGQAWDPAFSPDGRTILFSAAPFTDDWEWLALWSVPADGGRASVLMERAALGAYSPDGTTIAFLCVALPGDGHVWVDARLRLADADGTHRRGVRGSKGDCGGGGEYWSWTYERPDWSPDGTRIAYADVSHELSGVTDSDVLIVDVASGSKTVVARGLHPSWVGDHTLIVERPEWRT